MSRPLRSRRTARTSDRSDGGSGIPTGVISREADVVEIVPLCGTIVVVGRLSEAAGLEIQLTGGTDTILLRLADCLLAETSSLEHSFAGGVDSAFVFIGIIADPAASPPAVDSDWLIRIERNGWLVRERTLRPHPLPVRELAAHPLLSLFHAAFVMAGLHAIAEVVAPTIEVRAAEALAASPITESARSGAAVVIGGRLANLGRRQLHVVSEDMLDFVPRSEIILRSDPDEQAGAGKSGASQPGGFLFVMAESGDADGFFFVETETSTGTSIYYGPFAKPSTVDRGAAAAIASAPFGRVFATPADIAERLYRPLVTERRQKVRADRVEFAPRDLVNQPRFSIVIPFYGDAFFLSCVNHLQRVCGAAFEIILVVDDPRIWGAVSTALERRRETLRLPITVLRCAANYGYGVANNLGAAAAVGDILFFMNSDVIVTTPEPLLAAADDIVSAWTSRAQHVVAGFSLLYEDDTVQHVGMEFARSPRFGNLYLAEHPMKGLPFALCQGPAIRRVPAVTGALFGIAREFYGQLGGFDEAYSRADFEDADLCLRAREQGAEIVTYVSPGLYHLERQSVRLLENARFQEIVTFLNCLQFNKRWAEQLDRPARIRKRTRGAPLTSPPRSASVHG